MEKTLPGDSINDSIFKTILRNFKELDVKFKSLVPKNRNKRGLVDLLGKTLKVIAGTMDSEDEKEIFNALQNLNEDTTHLIEENNKQVRINRELQEQIENLNKNIVNQQKYISNYIENMVLDTQIRDNFQYIKVIFQIHVDINSLLHFIDTLEDVILTSRLGILTRNILTERETELVTSTDEFRHIRIVSFAYEDDIVLTLLIPRFGKESFEKYILEPFLNKRNESLLFSVHEVLLDSKRNVYQSIVRDNKIKNLISIEDKCILDIFSTSIVNSCLKVKKVPQEEIKEIGFGLLVAKNVKTKEIKHNCNEAVVYLSGNKIIKFENCSININNQIFSNHNNIVMDHYINPGYIKEIHNNNTQQELSLDIVHIKGIENRKLIEKSNRQILHHNILLYIAIFVLAALIMVALVKLLRKRILYLNAPRTEALTNDGGVTVSSTDIPPTMSLSSTDTPASISKPWFCKQSHQKGADKEFNN